MLRGFIVLALATAGAAQVSTHVKKKDPNVVTEEDILRDNPDFYDNVDRSDPTKWDNHFDMERAKLDPVCNACHGHIVHPENGSETEIFDKCFKAVEEACQNDDSLSFCDAWSKLDSSGINMVQVVGVELYKARRAIELCPSSRRERIRRVAQQSPALSAPTRAHAHTAQCHSYT